MIENYPFINSVFDRVRSYFKDYSITMVPHTKNIKKLVFNEKQVVLHIESEILERQLALLGETGVFKTSEVWIEQINNLIARDKKRDAGYGVRARVPTFGRKYSNGVYVSSVSKKPSEVQIRFAIENTNTAKDAAAYLKMSKDTFLKYARELCPDALATLKTKSRTYQIKDPMYNNLSIDELLSGKFPYVDLVKLKSRLLRDCILEERCYHCGYALVREQNNQSPLVISFRDSTLDRTQLFQLDNLYLLCYNCKYVIEGKKIHRVQEKIKFEDVVSKKIEEIDIDPEKMARFKKILSNYSEIIEAKRKDVEKHILLTPTPTTIDNKKPATTSQVDEDELDGMFDEIWDISGQK